MGGTCAVRVKLAHPPDARLTTAEKLLAHNTREKKTLAWQRPESGLYLRDTRAKEQEMQR